MGDRVVGGD